VQRKRTILQEASELVKQAADILALVAEFSASDHPTVGLH
jgi:hypothetical protein